MQHFQADGDDVFAAIANLPRPTFEHSRKAIAAYDAGIDARYQQMIDARTNTDVEKACEEERAARAKLSEALFEDTKDRNSRDNCALVHPNTIRAWVEGKPTP